MDGYDAAVIGLGAAGCEAARTLTARGLRVVALDAGPRLRDDQVPERVAETGMWRRMFARRRRVQSRSVSYHPALKHLYVDDADNPYATRGGDPYLWIRGRQVGGRLHTWARMALRLSDRDLQRAAEDGHGSPWPIRYADLAPWYDEVETFHGLHGACDALPELPDGVLAGTAELREPAQLFRSRLEASWPERRVIVPRVLARHGGAVPKSLQAALDTGLLEVLSDAPAARILLDDSGRRAVGVEYVDGAGGRRRLAADAVFLCASAIESVRLLWNSRCAAHPSGLGNGFDQLGRYALDHNFVVGAGITGPDYRALQAHWQPREHNPADLAAELDLYIPDFSDSLADRDFVRGFGCQGRISPDAWGMGLFGEMLPNPDNRVTVADETDAAGIPIAHIRVRRGDNDLRMIARQKLELRRMAEAVGLKVVMPLPRLLRRFLWKAVGPEVGVMHLGIAIHETGGARMGDHPEHSVVDADNRLWGVEGVLVTDGACFPGTGCQNPTLTIMAVTARACARHAERVGAGSGPGGSSGTGSAPT